MPAGEAPLTVTIVTGFLGSGKTTLLNRILAGPGSRRVGLIVNEFGALGVDGALLASASESLIELPGGCICCATQGDLIRGVSRLLQQAPELDSLVIETSGLAQPAPIAEALSDYMGARELSDSLIVAVVDALNFDRNLDAAEVAFGQLAGADLLLLNKVDLVDAATPGLIERGLRTLNQTAPILACSECAVPIDLVLQKGSGREWNLDVPHGHSMQSLSLALPGVLDRQAFERWLARLAGVYRAKGFVRLADDRRIYALQKVGDRHSLTQEAVPEDTTLGLVFIGHDLDQQKLQVGLLETMAHAHAPLDV